MKIYYLKNYILCSYKVIYVVYFILDESVQSFLEFYLLATPLPTWRRDVTLGLSCKLLPTGYKVHYGFSQVHLGREKAAV